ncbi:MAG: DUF3108 domain-containing protein [Gammaproteobacteria bacterium]|nr:DUF3108 domain-containing protein [Gammaproteobacteria bacterium]
MMIRTARTARLAAVCMLAAWGSPVTAAAAALATYEAQYEVEYKGRRVGESELSMSFDSAADRYVFESRTEARGIARLLRPKPAIERSEFVVHDGMIRPLEFRFEDGSRKGEDNVDIAFDWNENKAAVTSEDGVAEFALTPGVLDRASLQAALMRDLSRERDPGPYVLVDEDALKTYRYSVGERRAVETGAGRFDAVAVEQVREGSSRTTLLWLAPKLDYLPVRIEQYRDGELHMSMTLESYSGLEKGSGPFSDEKGP